MDAAGNGSALAAPAQDAPAPRPGRRIALAPRRRVVIWELRVAGSSTSNTAGLHSIVEALMTRSRSLQDWAVVSAVAPERTEVIVRAVGHRCAPAKRLDNLMTQWTQALGRALIGRHGRAPAAVGKRCFAAAGPGLRSQLRADVRVDDNFTFAEAASSTEAELRVAPYTNVLSSSRAAPLLPHVVRPATAQGDTSLPSAATDISSYESNAVGSGSATRC